MKDFGQRKRVLIGQKKKEDRKEVSLEKNKYFLKQSITRPAKMWLFCVSIFDTQSQEKRI